MKHDERCADDIGDDECSICRGEISDEFIERVKAAAAAPVIVMSAMQAMVWLMSLSAGGVAKR